MDSFGYSAFSEAELETEAPERSGARTRLREAHQTYAALLGAGARLSISANDGHSGQEVLTIVPPAFQPGAPFEVRLHFHGWDSTPSRPAAAASLPARIAAQLRRAPQTVFVFPFATMKPAPHGRTRPVWWAPTDARRIVQTALRTAGVPTAPARLIVSGHSGGGYALIQLAAKGGLACDLLILEDCLYTPVKERIIAWAQTPQGRACQAVISFHGTNAQWLCPADLPSHRVTLVCGSSHYEHVLLDPHAPRVACDCPARRRRARGAVQHELGDASGEEQELDGGALFSGFTASERKAIAFTSTLETGHAFGLGGATGNFDGYGVSFGLMQWNIGAGSLQPQLLDFLDNQPDRFRAVFGADADEFARVLREGHDRAATKRQLGWVIERMNGGGKRLTPEWKRRWDLLAREPGFQKLQVAQVRRNLTRAVAYCRELGFHSERALVLVFDALAWPGPYWPVARFQRRKGGPTIREVYETEVARQGASDEKARLLVLAKVLGGHASERWRKQATSRKISIVNDGKHRIDVKTLALSDGPFTTSGGQAGSSSAPQKRAAAEARGSTPASGGKVALRTIGELLQRTRVAMWAVQQANDPKVGYSQSPARFGTKVDSHGRRYFDCSGLVHMAWKTVAGVVIPKTTAQMLATWRKWGDRVPKDLAAMMPGDLILKPGHVVMYVRDGLGVGAQTSNTAFDKQVRADVQVERYLAKRDSIVVRPRLG